MMDLGNHGGFILAAYLVAVMVIAALIGWIVLEGRALKKQMADLEARGIRRRSAKGSMSS